MIIWKEARETLKRRRISPPKTEESPRNRRRSPPQAKTSAQRRRITPPRTQNRPESHETERTNMPVTYRFVLEKDMEEEARNRCSFCSQRHFSDRCGNHVEMEERKRILTEKNRCWRCLLVRQPGHNCSSRKCFYCAQYGDNEAICTRP
ncbi:hypothetical protein CRE_20841 [Caenorhabditis remanei]|uniref:Uncharacterized protein n=1 Tax=Caenorhabditis remanei TaxID=31234 RepID=E3MV31_CAERE|nr:hypothetical protein CRE_20841 [Caenorhabditis remanei]